MTLPSPKDSPPRASGRAFREEYGFGQGYASVKRFVRKLKGAHPEVADVMEHPPGHEAQVDFFQVRPP